MVTELSRYNFDLEVISDHFFDNRWILVARAYRLIFSVNLTSDHLLSDLKCI